MTNNNRIETVLMVLALCSLAVRYAETQGIDCDDQMDLPARKKAYAKGFCIYCYKPNTNWPALKSFSSLYVSIEPVTKGYVPTLYYGQNVSEVQAKREDKGLLNFPSMILWSQLQSRMSTLEQSCIGVDSNENFTLEGKLRVFDVLYVGMFAAGLVVFYSAPYFSRSVYFHYSSGVAIGVLASFLVVIYILRRFIPKNVGALTFLIGGSSIALYYIQKIAVNALQSEYRDYIALYFVISGVIGFIICYWYGPFENERTLHILKHGLHTVGIILIYSGLQHKPTAVVFIVLLISVTYFFQSAVLRPWWLSSRISRWWRRWNYPPVRHLTMEEYEEQGRIETEKALAELREYCNSPECNPWKMMSRVHSPERFAKFVLGEDHVSEDELTLYESDMSLPPDSLLTSDDSEDL